MERYGEDLLKAAAWLLRRPVGQRGRLQSALVRRSISTTYYALFHFVVEEATLRIVGAGSSRLRRRRFLAREFSHRGIKSTLDRLSGGAIKANYAGLLANAKPGGDGGAPPAFAKNLATVFADALARREEADYDLNEPVSELDARTLHTRVTTVIAEWNSATTQADREFKLALFILMLRDGKLRQP